MDVPIPSAGDTLYRLYIFRRSRISVCHFRRPSPSVSNLTCNVFFIISPHFPVGNVTVKLRFFLERIRNLTVY